MAREMTKSGKSKARSASGDHTASAVTQPVVANARVTLAQDPHAVRGEGERRLEVAIGREIRTVCKQAGITVSELAGVSGISIGMLSKIENGLTSPSLTSLQSVSHALGIPISQLLRRFEEDRQAVQVKAGAGLAAERRGSRAGHQYQLLGYLGDSLFFDADAPHGPERLIRLPARYLSIICYPQASAHHGATPGHNPD